VPKHCNTRDEYKQIEEGETPVGWDDNPNMERQIDKDSRLTSKHCKSYHCYKNHIDIDQEYKLFRRYGVTDASLKGSQSLR